MAQPEGGSGLGSLGDLEQHAASKGVHFHLAAEDRLAQRDRQLAGEVRAAAREDGVRHDLRNEVEVPRVRARYAACTGTNAAGQS